MWKLSVQRGLGDAERIRAMLAMAARVLDMDLVVLGEFGHFKMVNDRYGHAVGDEVLKAVARRFEAGLREGHWLACWGG